MEYQDIRSCFFTFKTAAGNTPAKVYDALFAFESQEGRTYLIYADADDSSDVGIYAGTCCADDILNAEACADSGCSKPQELEIGPADTDEELDMIQRALLEIESIED